MKWSQDIPILSYRSPKLTGVFSAEGSVDPQTIYGKTIRRVAALCQKHAKPLLVLCGSINGDLSQLYAAGVTAIFPIGNTPPI